MINIDHEFSTEDYLNMDLLRFTTAGSVDDGKSTLIGRLLHDTKSIFECPTHPYTKHLLDSEPKGAPPEEDLQAHL